MKGVDRVWAVMKATGDPMVDLSMAQALPTADSDAQVQMVRLLLDRGHQPALAALVRHFHALDLELQRMISSRISEMETAIRSVAGDRDRDTRLNVINLVTQSRSYHLTYLLSAQLQWEDRDVQRAAASGLLELGWILQFATQHPEAEKPEIGVTRAVGLFSSALLEAFDSYHKHKEHMVLMAAACLAPRKPPQLLERLTNRRSAVYGHLKQVILQLDHHLINRALLCYAGISGLRSVVVEALRRKESQDRLEQLMASVHLLVAPEVRLAVRQIGQADHLLPSEQLLLRLPPDRQRLVPMWLLALRANSARKAALLAEMASTVDRAQRMLVLRAMMAMRTRVADDRVVMMCLDADPIIARIALRHLILRQWVGLTRLLGLMVDSPHLEVRRIAERYLMSVGFGHLWDKWDRLDPQMRLSAGRVLVKGGGHLIQRLAGKMKSRDNTDRFKAIAMARSLKCLAGLETSFAGLMADPDPRVAASAAAALGQIPSGKTFVRGLAELLQHRNDRVRANAIESLMQLGVAGAYRDLLVHVAGAAAGPRSAANAAWILGRLGDSAGGELLTRLLQHPRARTRLSALWVVEHEKWAEGHAIVTRMMVMDPDPEVRSRAGRVQGVLEAEYASLREQAS